MLKCKILNFSRETELNKYKTDRKLLGNNSSNKALEEKKMGWNKVNTTSYVMLLLTR